MLSRFRVFSVVFVTLVLITTAGCGTLIASNEEEPTPTPVPPPDLPPKPTYTVTRGLIIDKVSFTARVAPVIEEELFFRESGRVKKVYIERNEMVEEGALLAELENDDLVRQLAQAQIELDTTELNLEKAQEARQYAIDRAEIELKVKGLQLAKSEGTLASLDIDEEVALANLKKAQAGATTEDIAIAEGQLEKARSALWGSQSHRDSVCGQSRGADCDIAEASVQQADDNVRIAELSLQKLRRGPSEEDLIILDAAYRRIPQQRKQTEIDLEIQRHQITLAELELDKLKGEVDPQLIKAVERSKLSVERLRAQVDNTRIVSPIVGKVTAISVRDGRAVNAFDVVFIVADEGELELASEPDKQKLSRLSEGMEVTINMSTYPTRELSGTILALPYPYGTGGGKTAEDADKITHIAFDPQDLELSSGDLVKVNAILERKEEALWLPPAAFNTFAGRKFALISEEGRQRRVDVTLGVESEDRVEILEGLEEGQVVVGP